MAGENLTALPTLIWIGEHPFWTLLTLSLMLIHFWRRPGQRRELLSELSFVMISAVVILLIQLEGGWFKLPLPHQLLIEISTLLAGLILVKIWGSCCSNFCSPSAMFGSRASSPISSSPSAISAGVCFASTPQAWRSER